MTHRLLKTLIVAACASLVGAAPVWAGPGALDTSFGQGGVAIADFGTFSNGAVVDNAQGNAMVVQSDGKVIVVGTGIDQFGQTSDIVTARFTAAGALDPSWGSNANGKAQFDFGQNETGYGAVLQPDGKLIIGGDTVGTTGTSDVLAVRVATNGTLDGTFGSQGRAHPDFGDQEFGRAIALRSDGRIVIAGYGPHGAVVVRLTNGGAPDTTFNGTGEQVESTFQGPPSADAVAFAANGTADIAGTLHDTIVDRYDLMIGNTPDSNGYSVAAPDLGGTYDDATAIAELPGGSRLLAGYSNVGGTDDFALARFAPDSGFDSTFGSAGKVLTDLGGTDDAHAMVVQPDGKIVVAGTSTVGSGSTAARRIGVVRFLPNGQLDTTFGTNGVEIVAIAGAKLDGNAVGLQANGDIIVGGTITPAGSTRKQLLAIRLHGDATGSTSTGGGSTTTTTTTTGGGSTGGGAGTTGGGGAVSETIPLLTSLMLTPFAFSAASSGPTVIASPTSRKGTLIAYKLNVAATVSFVVERSLPGRRQLVNGRQRCVAQTHKNEHAGACVRVAIVGRFTQAGAAGANSLRFSGRIDAEKLPRGNYAIVATPRTLVGGHAVSKTFKIKG